MAGLETSPASQISGLISGGGGILCVLIVYSRALPRGSHRLADRKTPHYPTPSYLLTAGPYRHSCNPIYLAELVIWLGWIVFYGSFFIALLFAVVALLVGPVIVPREERGLEARFGDQYREFRRTTPRWLGKTRR